MDFARSHLEKHGWSEGKGLGHGENGMKEAIKVKLKFDSTGVGHNAGDEFSYHWWENVFNQAASNIKVMESQEGVQLNTKEELVVSTKKPLSKYLANKEMLYGRFIKAGTLTDGKMTAKPSSDSDSEEDEVENAKIRQCTDEELFKICGGRTAHKGARHGLTASAKLARIQKQEDAFLAMSTSPSSQSKDGQHKSKEENRIKQGCTENEVLSEVAVDNCNSKKKKKKRKKSKMEDRETDSKSKSSGNESESNERTGEECIEESKRRKMKKDLANANQCVETMEHRENIKRKKSKKTKISKELEIMECQRNGDLQNGPDTDVNEEEGSVTEKKKKRKRSKKDIKEETIDVACEPSKKKKKKTKK